VFFRVRIICPLYGPAPDTVPVVRLSANHAAFAFAVCSLLCQAALLDHPARSRPVPNQRHLKNEISWIAWSPFTTEGPVTPSSPLPSRYVSGSLLAFWKWGSLKLPIARAPPPPHLVLRTSPILLRCRSPGTALCLAPG